MNRYSLSHVSDQSLLRELRALVAQDRATTAMLVAYLGEVDARRLYAEAGHPSMFAWCVGELGFSEDGAYKRIRAARVARQYPAIHAMLADGRLHLGAVVALTPYLAPGNAEELLAAAAHRSRAAIEQLLAERFPRPDVPGLVRSLDGEWAAARPPQAAADGAADPESGLLVQCDAISLAPGPVKFSTSEHGTAAVGDSRPETAAPLASGRARVTPLAPQRYAVQFTMDQEAHDDLLYAQALLGHAVPNGDPAAVFARALKALITQLEKRKFAKTDRPRPCRRGEDPRQVPADVKRAVWERDGGRCTFVGGNGRRCEARTRLEYDHVEPVADGGQPTERGLRLRCRAHNQLEAERRFGREFVARKREGGGGRASAETPRRETRGKCEPAPHVAELVPWLRTLGLRADEARRVAEQCPASPDAPLEERLRAALRCHGGPRGAVTRPAA